MTTIGAIARGTTLSALSRSTHGKGKGVFADYEGPVRIQEFDGGFMVTAAETDAPTLTLISGKGTPAPGRAHLRGSSAPTLPYGAPSLPVYGRDVIDTHTYGEVPAMTGEVPVCPRCGRVRCECPPSVTDPRPGQWGVVSAPPAAQTEAAEADMPRDPVELEERIAAEYWTEGD